MTVYAAGCHCTTRLTFPFQTTQQTQTDPDLSERARLGCYHVKPQLVRSGPEYYPITTNYLLMDGLSPREPRGVVIESYNDQSHQRLYHHISII